MRVIFTLVLERCDDGATLTLNAVSGEEGNVAGFQRVVMGTVR